jgi:prepilin-type N-terminal cleavage/methylation domain-containing protein
MQLRSQTERRPGFTLVELLVVLAIVGVLVGLVAAAVLQFYIVGPRLQTQTELSHLHQAVEAFKQKYNMYPPSKIFLANTQADYVSAAQFFTNKGDSATATVINNSWQWINRIFPKLDWSGVNGAIDWTGGQVPPAKFKGTFLEGDQALVFFLGGMQTNSQGVNSVLGFAANSKNPTLMTGNRLDPLYEFTSKRLNQVPTRNYPAPYNLNPFFVYADPYDAAKPYVYFSTYGTRNGYQMADCLSQGLTAGPYYEAANPVRYLNPNTFQIISAGADGLYGQGGLWSPGLQPVDAQTKDNQSNFNNGGLMGTRG